MFSETKTPLIKEFVPWSKRGKVLLYFIVAVPEKLIEAIRLSKVEMSVNREIAFSISLM